MLCQKLIWGGILALALCFGASPLTASITYPDMTGITVVYENITESSGTDPVPLYGQPTITGDTLHFPTTAQFSAVAQGVVTSDITDGRLTFKVSAKEGLHLGVISLFETGAFNAFGDSSTLAAANGAIVATFAVGNSVQTQSVAFNGHIKDTTDESPFIANSWGVWEATATLDLSQHQITEATIVIDNILVALAPGGNGAAIIDKKSFTVEVTAIPEPASLALLGVGTLLIVARRRRRLVHNN